MSKALSEFTCQECGTRYRKWQGKCDGCGAWNTIFQESLPTSPFIKKKKAANKHQLFDLDAAEQKIMRDVIGIEEFDRTLGGGMVKGSVTLLGGEPGIGKSTILLQLASKLAENERKTLYISGEESLEQIKLRAKRLQTINPHTKVATITLLSDILTAINELSPEYGLIIIDSIQTLYHDEINSAPGTVSQVRACAFELIRAAKSKNIALILVGHVTKDGQIAGPKVLEHMVDTVLYFEGDHNNEFRIIRSVKNRFGAANEIGIFEMTESGLVEVKNPSSIFLPSRDHDISGSTIFPGMEGSRPILLEIQALIVPSFLATPRRGVVGWDVNRLAMMIAVLNARFGLNLLDKEVYLNVTGGLKINEPGADIAVAAALISAASNLAIDGKTVFIGEVGLSGELRQTTHMEQRLNEAYKLGFKSHNTSG
jgi:DNA repair protein RadA/Sms